MAAAETKQRIPHVLVDTDYWEKPEVSLIIDRFGYCSAVAVQRLWLCLMNEHEATLPRISIDGLATRFGMDRAVWAQVIDLLLSNDLAWLVETADGKIQSPRIASERARILNKREIYSENGKRSATVKQRSSNSRTIVKPRASKSTDTVTVTVTGSETGSSEEMEGESGQALTLLQGERLRAMFGDAPVEHYEPVCRDYLKAEGKRKKDFEAFVRNWIRKDKHEAIGFFATRGSRNGRQPTAFELNMQERDRLLRAEAEKA